MEFSIIDAKQASELYITQLWKAVRERCKFTDISDSPCSFSEAPAEGIFSVYGHVLEGREKLTVENAVRLTRVVLHGPPPATSESAQISKEAMEKILFQVWREILYSTVEKRHEINNCEEGYGKEMGLVVCRKRTDRQ